MTSNRLGWQCINDFMRILISWKWGKGQNCWSRWDFVGKKARITKVWEQWTINATVVSWNCRKDWTSNKVDPLYASAKQKQINSLAFIAKPCWQPIPCFYSWLIWAIMDLVNILLHTSIATIGICKFQGLCSNTIASSNWFEDNLGQRNSFTFRRGLMEMHSEVASEIRTHFKYLQAYTSPSWS